MWKIKHLIRNVFCNTSSYLLLLISITVFSSLFFFYTSTKAVKEIKEEKPEMYLASNYVYSKGYSDLDYPYIKERIDAKLIRHVPLNQTFYFNDLISDKISSVVIYVSKDTSKSINSESDNKRVTFLIGSEPKSSNEVVVGEELLSCYNLNYKNAIGSKISYKYTNNSGSIIEFKGLTICGIISSDINKLSGMSNKKSNLFWLYDDLNIFVDRKPIEDTIFDSDVLIDERTYYFMKDFAHLDVMVENGKSRGYEMVSSDLDILTVLGLISSNAVDKAITIVWVIFGPIFIFVAGVMIVFILERFLNERLREIKIMKYLGLGKFSFAVIFVIELFVLFSISVLASYFIANALYSAFSHMLSEKYMCELRYDINKGIWLLLIFSLIAFLVEVVLLYRKKRNI